MTTFPLKNTQYLANRDRNNTAQIVRCSASLKSITLLLHTILHDGKNLTTGCTQKEHQKRLKGKKKMYLREPIAAAEWLRHHSANVNYGSQPIRKQGRKQVNSFEHEPKGCICLRKKTYLQTGFEWKKLKYYVVFWTIIIVQRLRFVTSNQSSIKLPSN